MGIACHPNNVSQPHLSHQAFPPLEVKGQPSKMAATDGTPMAILIVLIAVLLIAVCSVEVTTKPPTAPQHQRGPSN